MEFVVYCDGKAIKSFKTVEAAIKYVEGQWNRSSLTIVGSFSEEAAEPRG